MIQMTDVTKVYHRGETEVRALRGVTGEIPTGAFAFLLGPSGSGKSTLLHLIGALDEPSSGHIDVHGKRLGAMNRNERDEYRRHRVGFVFQSFNLLSNLSAVDNVLVPYMPVGVKPEQHARAVALLKQVGLGERLDHRPNQLSGGEQQRVAIARALLKQPDLVLADEPTGELDSVNGAEIYRYLRLMHREHGSTIIIVTHDAQYIEPTDVVLRMKDGKLVNDQSPNS